MREYHKKNNPFNFRPFIMGLLVLLFGSLFVTLESNAQSQNFENQLLPFVSDGCSAIPDGLTGKNHLLWQNCCIEHDKSYWKGGTADEKINADIALGQCLDKKTGLFALGKSFEWGVRVGGKAGSYFSWRWGYGWVINRGYEPLSEYQKQWAQALLPSPDDDIIIQSVPWLQPKITITGDYCIDTALWRIAKFTGQEAMNFHIIEDQTRSIVGTFRHLLISSDLCEQPVEFKFEHLKSNACTKPQSDFSYRTHVRMKSTTVEQACSPLSRNGN